MIFDSDTIPRDRRAELESVVVATGKHLVSEFLHLGAITERRFARNAGSGLGGCGYACGGLGTTSGDDAARFSRIRCSSRWTTQGRFDGKYFRTRPVAELGPCDSGGFKKFTFTRSDILAEHALLAGMPGSFDSGGVRP